MNPPPPAAVRAAAVAPAPHPLAMLFAGSGEFGLPTLAALLAAGHRIVHVFSQPDRPAGRGRQLSPTAIAQFALEHHLPLTRTDNLNALTPPPADAMVVIAFGQKISRTIADSPRLGSINLHASRLPRYRGAAPINWAILNGEGTAGNSVIRLAERMDAGAILAQSEIPIAPTESAGELHDRLAADGAPLVLAVLEALASGTAIETPQNDTGASIAPKLSRQSAVIDFRRSPGEVAAQINGLSPWPGCRVKLLKPTGEPNPTHLTLLRAEPIATATAEAPGRLLDSTGSVATGNGAVKILQLQPAGKRPMSVAEFRCGNAWAAGMRIESVQ